MSHPEDEPAGAVPMMGTCGVCRGAGNLLSAARGRPLAWYPCPECGTAGVYAMAGPPTIRSHARD